jgi:hypothetical protein
MAFCTSAMSLTGSRIRSERSFSWCIQFAIPVLADPVLLKKHFLSDSSVHIIGCQHGNPDQIAPQPRGCPSLKDFPHDTRTKQAERSGWGVQGSQLNRIRVG